MAETQDVNTLRRRGRRRLVGAIALVLLAAIVLPMVFDPEPATNVPPVSLRIPSEDGSDFKPKVTPKPAASVTPAAGSDAAKDAPEPARTSTEKPATKLEKSDPAPSVPTVAAPAVSSAAAGPVTEQFVVPVAALSNQGKVRNLLGRLKAAKLPYYTEPLATEKGNVTRVRVGPYGSREAAEQAQRELQRLGLKPGNVMAKP